MGRQASQLTKDIRYAIGQGMSNQQIADLLECTKSQVANIRYRDMAKNKAKKQAKQREYNARYRARKKAQERFGPIVKVKVSDDEIDALRNVPNPTMPITMEGPVKYTWWERVRIFFRGW